MLGVFRKVVCLEKLSFCIGVLVQGLLIYYLSFLIVSVHQVGFNFNN
jgi:hypothetical protein